VPAGVSSARLAPWRCSCLCSTSENHFGLAAFPAIFRIINFVQSTFISLHRAVLFKQLGPFSLSSFPHLALDFSYFFQLFSSCSFYMLFLSHLTVVSLHTGGSTSQLFCSLSDPMSVRVQSVPTSFCPCTFCSAREAAPPLVPCSSLHSYIARASS